ncbi:MAG: ATP-binding protein [Pyrinomonadaceae bacterium]
MDLNSLVNITIIMEGLQTLLISIVVFYFYFTYRKNYLLLWAWSWLFCSFYLFGSSFGFAMSSYLPALNPFRLLNAVFYLSSGYLQVPLLILGSYELATDKPVSRKTLSWYSALSIFAGVVMTFATAYTTDSSLRFILRISSHALIASAAFLIGAFCISMVWRNKRSTGKRIVLASFLVYGVYQFLYVTLPFITVKLIPTFLLYYILIETILLFWIALGLIVWLLDDERERAVAATDALLASEALFRQLTEHNAAGIFILQNEIVRYINPTATAILKFNPGELLGLSFLKQVHPDFIELARKNYEKLIAGISVPRGEAKMLRQDNSECWLEMTGATIEFQNKPAVLITGIDVTEHKQAQEQLMQAQRLESIGMLAGGVAHDFNNMLTGMIGFTEMAILKVQPDHPAARNLHRVKELCGRAADLTKQLLAFARRQILLPQVLNINDTVRETVGFLRHMIGENIEIEISLAEDLSFVKADATQIRQILTNLALNGRDAMPDGGKLIIKTCNSGANIQGENPNNSKNFNHSETSFSGVELIITDTGTGMNSETRARIFEPFFTTKEMGRGTGLGLAIVYGIVKQHNGSISVASEPGAGTTFVIRLPEAQAVELIKTLPADGKNPAKCNETILIAEDEQSVRELMQEILSADGYNVLTASDGAEALEFFDRYAGGQISLVITDALMPKIGGEHVFKTLREKQPDLPFLFISGYGLKIPEQDWTNKMDLLLKPFDPEILRQKVRQILNHSTNLNSTGD